MRSLRSRIMTDRYLPMGVSILKIYRYSSNGSVSDMSDDAFAIMVSASTAISLEGLTIMRSYSTFHPVHAELLIKKENGVPLLHCVVRLALRSKLLGAYPVSQSAMCVVELLKRLRPDIVPDISSKVPLEQMMLDLRESGRSFLG